MADVVGLFSEYKVGGISDFLNDENEGKDEKANIDELSTLFKNKSKSREVLKSQKVEKEHASISPVQLPKQKKNRGDGDPETAAGKSFENARDAESSGSKFTGKRKQADPGSTNEPSRKRQRENRKKHKQEKTDEEEDDEPDSDERLERTIFVGNIPVSATRKELKSFFSKYGAVESVRLRSVPIAKAKGSKRVAILTKKFHPERNSMNAYVVFSDNSTAEQAVKSRGLVFKDMHLRVDTAVKKDVNYKLSVFVGNLPFNIQEEEVREHFSQCGDVDDVRIIRDKETGIGKGFGYVRFQKAECVGFAIKLQNSELKGRRIRVFKSVDKNDAKKTFDKKKDRQYRMKAVVPKNSVSSKGESKKFTSNRKNYKNKNDQKKGGKGFSKGGKGFSKGGAKFNSKKGRGSFMKKK